MHARGREAHIERPSRRRDALALGISFLIHALVVLLVVFFWNVSPGGAPAESDVTADVILEEAARAAQPPLPAPAPTRARTPTQAPVPVATPVPQIAARPVPRRRTRPPTPPPPRHREL
ncbi:MAG TPA: hypothetical protein VE826_00065, partial [Dongiaceae bacterium]|nr:hypothetical protein [Dongiaceae bacterium]